MNAVILASESAAHTSAFNWEMGIVVTNMMLVVVTLLAIVIDNKIMVKAIVRIVSMLAPTRKTTRSAHTCEDHKGEGEGHNAHTD